jgi:hypothetical protein
LLSRCFSPGWTDAERTSKRLRQPCRHHNELRLEHLLSRIVFHHPLLAGLPLHASRIGLIDVPNLCAHRKRLSGLAIEVHFMLVGPVRDEVHVNRRSALRVFAITLTLLAVSSALAGCQIGGRMGVLPRTDITPPPSLVGDLKEGSQPVNTPPASSVNQPAGGSETESGSASASEPAMLQS